MGLQALPARAILVQRANEEWDRVRLQHTAERADLQRKHQAAVESVAAAEPARGVALASLAKQYEADRVALILKHATSRARGIGAIAKAAAAGAGLVAAEAAGAAAAEESAAVETAARAAAKAAAASASAYVHTEYMNLYHRLQMMRPPNILPTIMAPNLTVMGDEQVRLDRQFATLCIVS